MATELKRKKWTVMIYMAAARDEETERAALADLRELERVGSSKDVEIVVQLHRLWPRQPQRFRVEREAAGGSLVQPFPCCEECHNEAKQSSKSSVSGLHRPFEPDMTTGDREPLRSFVCWARRHHAAERYLLVLWGHTYGLGFGRDPADPLTLNELREALTIEGEGKWISVLGANSCAMSFAEAAIELDDVAEHLVASRSRCPSRAGRMPPSSRSLSRIPRCNPPPSAS